MLLAPVEYVRPSSLAEALEALGRSPNARALAGGQTLINVMKARAAAPDLLVDLADLGELRGISEQKGTLEIGAMTTYAELMDSREINSARPILARVASEIADVQVRNRGTIGGNVCLSDPTNHFPPLMVAMNATMTIVGPSGERPVHAGEFFLGVYMTAVQPGEVLTKITIPSADGDGFASVTIGREGTCIVNAAATRTNGDTRVAIGCVSAVPVLGLDGLDPPSDVHGSADYRRHLAKVLAARAIKEAGG
jgi:aerobic carbon-monoxide dehydrogenase medium subunit